MAQLVVRNLDDEVKERLKQRAEKNGRSLEAEVRYILSASVALTTQGFWRSIADRARGSGFTDEDIQRMADLRNEPVLDRDEVRTDLVAAE